jgi:CMP-N-acetylneuraminic acid synthetase
MPEIVIIVPARGGSKRVPRKNIVALGGRPLLEWTLARAHQALPDKKLIVSTDDDEISRIAKNSGALVIKRPEKISGARASTESTLLDVNDQLGYDPDWVMCLPPTSPFRSTAIISTIAAMAGQDGAVDCYFTVTESRGDFWRPERDGSWLRMEPDAPRRQQDRIPLYEENSAIYLTRVSALRETGFIMGNRAVGVPMVPHEAIDINTADDIKLAEALLQANLIPKLIK